MGSSHPIGGADPPKPRRPEAIGNPMSCDMWLAATRGAPAIPGLRRFRRHHGLWAPAFRVPTPCWRTDRRDQRERYQSVELFDRFWGAFALLQVADISGSPNWMRSIGRYEAILWRFRPWFARIRRTIRAIVDRDAAQVQFDLLRGQLYSLNADGPTTASLAPSRQLAPLVSGDAGCGFSGCPNRAVEANGHLPAGMTVPAC